MNTNSDYYTHTLEQQAYTYLRKLTRTLKKYRNMKLRSLSRLNQILTIPAIRRQRPQLGCSCWPIPSGARDSPRETTLPRKCLQCKTKPIESCNIFDKPSTTFLYYKYQYEQIRCPKDKSLACPNQ